MTDTPHYVTPEEAEKMSCPQRFHWPESLSGPYTGGCIGPKCMAWRWAQMLGWQEGRDELVTYSTTHGYCGMVRS